MARVLHLSDVHLGEPAAWQLLGDHKSGIASGDQRVQKDVLLETLDALTQANELETMDAAVISGDLTNRSGSQGFDEFAELLETLTASIDPSRIVVVPGNHDVPWDPGPTDPKRYDGFLAVTREKGLVTPLLDGIDFDMAGKLDPAALDNPHVVSHDDFLIIAINSSHFCWGLEPLDDEAAEELLTLGSDELKDVVTDLRRHDVARVSNAQMRALTTYLREQSLMELDGDPVRIATLHHQLLPVSSREEFKSFESLTNLGAVRELLVSLGTHLVLHGHKHESALYWDYVAEARDLEAPPHRFLVSAAPGDFAPGKPIMRILEITGRSAARDVDVTDLVAPVRTAGPVQRATRRARVWNQPAPDQVADAMTVRGDSVSDVYARIQSMFDGRGHKPLNDLVCEVLSPHDAGVVPADYPPLVGVASRQQWMTDLIDWWQLREPQLLEKVGFNHGERLYRRWGDQVRRVAATLAASRTDRVSTTRAVMLLVDPATEAGDAGRAFPSFVLVQLQLIPEGVGRRLDCTGYFRKQEMRYWWPINVAELARVQSDVLALVQDLESPVTTGRLRTITAQALAEDRIPAVAVPAIDRALDQHPKRLWDMAQSIASPEEAEAGARDRWREYLVELQPDGDAAPPISHVGLAQVETYVRWLGASATAAGQALHDLVQLYALVANPSGIAAPAFAANARERLAALDTALDQALGEPSEQ